jgi:hypothetical protein
MSGLRQSIGQLGSTFFDSKLVGVNHHDKRRLCPFVPLPAGVNFLDKAIEHPNVVPAFLHLTCDE